MNSETWLVAILVYYAGKRLLMPASYSPSGRSSECKFGDDDAGHYPTPSITIPALIAAIIAEEEWTGGFCRVRAGMVFYTRESTYTKGCPMDAKEEKKEEYYKGKEVKGKLEKKKEEYYKGKEVKGEK